MGNKTYDHAVIYDGVLYPANTPIEEKKVVEKKATETVRKASKKAGTKNDDNDGTV